MSDAPVRERVNPRRAEPVRPLYKSRWPWKDRSGRFSAMKATMLVAAILPGAWLAVAWATHMLGPRAATEVIHGTGQWAVRFLLLSLLVSPARAIVNWHRLMLLRRQIGLTALAYAVAHLVLYACSENWRMLHVVSEIALRFYLTIGFVALLGLAVLGVTSTDGMLRRLGHRWKQLHRLVYPLAVLAIFHFFLQSKAEVGEATLMAGMFLWLMGWRLLPAGPDRQPLPILGLGVLSALVTAGVEYAWFGLATHIAPSKPVLAELNVTYGPHPAVQVLLLGVGLAIAAGLFWAQHRERLRQTLVFDIALYAGGALIATCLACAFSLTDDVLPDDWSFWPTAAWFVAGAGVLGVARWWLPRRRLALDVVCAVCLAGPLVWGLAF